MLTKPRLPCLVCQKPVSSTVARYCSNLCQMNERYQLYISRWKVGLEDGIVRPYELSNHIRRYLVEKGGNKCSRCGWAELNVVTGNVPLQVEHIDGNWQNCREENLVLLCPNCHSLTPTFGALNKGKGRLQRHNKSKSRDFG